MRLLLVITLLLNLSCSHNPAKNRFKELITSGDCEAALAALPSTYENVNPTDKISKAATTAASYVATGAGYTADLFITTGKGILVLAAFGVLCVAPTIITERNLCLVPLAKDLKLSKFKSSKLGQKTFEKTKTWRCPKLNEFSRSIQEVASCYSNRKDKESLEKALSNLKELKSKDLFWNCLDKDRRYEIDKQIEQIEPAEYI